MQELQRQGAQPFAVHGAINACMSIARAEHADVGVDILRRDPTWLEKLPL
jgi:hypothetical protein